MKTTTAKATIELVSKLSDLIEQRRQLDALEKDLKASLKEILANAETSVLSAGDYVVVLSTRKRTDLDKDQVKALLGDKYSDVLKVSEYQTLEIKKA